MSIILPNFILNWIKKSSKVSNILIAPGSKGAVWSGDDYKTIAKESYLKNTIAFACIFEIAKCISSVPWKLFRRVANGKREPIKDHYLNDLLAHPNPDDSFNYLMFKSAAFLAMDGNSYIERVSPKDGRNKGITQELFVHRPDRVTIYVNPSTGQLNYYEYTVDGRTITWKVDPITHACDILHFKLFHPLDDWYGSSPTKSIAREVDASNEAAEWNMKMLQNEGRPGMIVTLIGQLGEQQFEEFERKLNEKYSGAQGAGKNMLLSGERGTEAKPYGWTPHELDNLEGGRELARRIAMGYGMPPMLLGIPGDSTYSIPYNEKVLLSNNEEKPIGEIKEGDCVYSFDRVKGCPCIKKVKWQGKTGEKNTFTVKAIGIFTNSTYELEATDNHPFLIFKNIFEGELKNSYILLKDLKVGDCLLSMNDKLIGEYAEIFSIEENKLIQSVYDIEIEESDNFFANGICVHNSNQKEARQAFWETTIFFYLQYIRNEMNNWFFPKESKDKDLFLDYILDEVPALAPRRDLIWQRCQKSDFLTVNEKREMIGMPSIGSLGDVILVPSANIKLEDVGLNYEQVDKEEDEEDEDTVDKLSDFGLSEEETNLLIGNNGNKKLVAK